MNHVSSEELGAYLANLLPSAERESVERHLVSCTECRAELVEGQRAIASAPSGARIERRWLLIGGLAAAAAVAIVLLPRAASVRNPAGVERVIQSTRSADAVVTVVSPSIDGEINSSTPGFTWRKNDDASYRITVTDAAGRSVWTASTSDTAIALPATVQLSRGQQFFWYVDALRSDGRSVTSGVNNFHTSR